MKEDILVELSDSDLEELANQYKAHKDELPHFHSFLQTCLKSKKNGMTGFVTVFSPRNCWRDDGTFFASMPNNGPDIVLHSLDPSGKNLIEGLTKTRRFKYLQDPAREYTMFYATHELFCSKIREVLTEVLNHELYFVHDSNFWCLKKEKAVKLNFIPPDDVYVKELEPSEIPIVNNVWPSAFPGSEQKLLDWLKLNKGYGVYLKSNNQLVSWVTSSCLGQFATLQTLEEHKKKGYASLAVIGMAKYLAANGFDSCALILSGNTASEALFGKLGFEKSFAGQNIAVCNKY